VTDVDVADARNRHRADRSIRWLVGDVVRVDEAARFAAGRHLNGAYGVEAKAHEVDEIVVRERLAADVRVHEPERAEAALGGAKATDVREHELSGIADDHGVDLTGAMDQNADLTACLERSVDERAHELGGRQMLDRNASTIEPEKRPLRGRRKSGGIAVKLDETDPALLNRDH
jgi:hypothetical protein